MLFLRADEDGTALNAARAAGERRTAPADLAPPGVFFRGDLVPADAMSAAATHHHARVVGCLPASAPCVATVLVNDPDAIALLFALSAIPLPCMLVPADRRMPAPPAPGIPLFLASPASGLAERCRRAGWQTTVLDAPPRRSPGPAPAFLATPGLIFFSSGSTAAPRPIFRSTPAALASVAARLAAHGVPRGGRVLASLPLDRAFGFNQGVLAATIVGGVLGLMERFDPKPWVDMVAAHPHDYWAGSTAMADVLATARLAATCVAPVTCSMVGRISESLFQRFAARFGRPLRGHYGATETGSVTTDAAPAGAVRPATVGVALPGVEVRIGDDADRPVPPRSTGRIWVRSPWLVHAYGVPPSIEPAVLRDGWWATPDLGFLDAHGALTLAGRIDDRVKTSAGHLVDLEEVASVLRAYPGVADAVAVPVESGGRMVFGALVEAETRLTTEALRTHVALNLPAWAQPRVVEIVTAIPRLPDGKPDRRACAARLKG